MKRVSLGYNSLKLPEKLHYWFELDLESVPLPEPPKFYQLDLFDDTDFLKAYGQDTSCSISRPGNSVGYMIVPAIFSITSNPGELYGR